MKPQIAVKTKVVERLLAERNLPRKWLIQRVNISRGYMAQLLNGTRHPSAELRAKIMAVLEVKNFTDLFTIIK